MRPDPPNADSLFLAAAGHADPRERAKFLDDACRGNQPLRNRVEQLLAAQSNVGSFLESPAPELGPTLDQPTLTEKAGTQIGAYKLREKIGEGGFGAVYVAEQEQPVARKVALKIIKPGMDTREIIARFEAERQALAVMEHPNIARVLDAGATESGRPYFVMELVKGVPITDFCDDRKLSTRERLQLFVDVCRAVQHAHQKGIIHRDLKPSNVMVTLHDDKPVVKVIDFGVSKALSRKLTEKTVYTAYGQMIGTPLYMSPEQAQWNDIDVDTRSDVYSLGVLLYELLTGMTPFDQETLQKSGFDEMRRIIREVEPPRPSARVSTLKAEQLSTVSGRRKTDPRKLSHHLRGELDWIVMKALEKDRNRRYESASAFAADVERYLADEPVQACPPSVCYRFGKFARRRKGSLVAAAVVLAFLLTIVGGVSWVVGEKAARMRELEIRVQAALDDSTSAVKNEDWEQARLGLARAESFANEGGLDERIAGRIDRLRRELKLVAALDEIRLSTFFDGDWLFSGLTELDLNKQADADCVNAFSRYGIDIDANDVGRSAALVRRSLVREQLIRALDHWAAVRRTIEPMRPARWQRPLEIARLADRDPLHNEIRLAWRASDSGTLQRFARSTDIAKLSPGIVVQVSRMLSRDARTRDLAIDLAKRVQLRHSGDFFLNFHLGDLLARAKPPQLAEALRYQSTALALRPNHPKALRAVAETLVQLDRFDEAKPLYEEIIRQQPTFGYNCLARAYSKTKKWESAVRIYSKSLRQKSNYWVTWNNRGAAYQNSKQYGKAIADYSKAIELKTHWHGTWFNRGYCYLQLKQHEKAVADFSKVIQMNPEDWKARIQRARCYIQLMQYDKAITDYRMAIRFNAKRARTWNGLGVVLAKQNKLNEAIACFRRAIKRDRQVGAFRVNLAHALLIQNKLDESIACCRKAIELDKNFAGSFGILGTAFYRQRKLDEAIASWHKAVKLDPKLLNPRRNLVLAHSLRSEWADVATQLKALIELQPSSHFASYQLAPLLLYLGKDAAYRRHCHEMLKRFENTKDARIAERIAKVCLLSPPTGADFRIVRKLADRARSTRGPDWFVPWQHLVAGMVAYRAGRFAPALRLLRDSQRQRGKEVGPYRLRVALAGFYVAMIQHRTGDIDAARNSLRNTISTLDHFEKENSNRCAWWWDALMCRIARHEAEVLLGRDSPVRAVKPGPPRNTKAKKAATPPRPR